MVESVFTTMSNLSSSFNSSDSLDENYTPNNDSSNIFFADDYPEDLPTTFWLNFIDTVNNNTRFTTPFIIVCGCVGNILAVCVFRLTTLRGQSSSYYLAALCISDSCFLLLTGTEYLSTHQYVNVYHRPITCEMFNYMSGLASFLSVWFVVAFTAERYVAVLHPLYRFSWCTVKRAKLVLAILTTVAMVLNAPLLYFSDLVPYAQSNRRICELAEHKKKLMRTFNYMDMFFVFLIPMLLIIVLNFKIAITIWSGIGFRKRMTLQQPRYSGNSVQSNRNLSNRSTKKQRASQTGNKNGDKTMKSQKKVTKTLLIISTVFVVLNSPSYLMRMWTFYDPTTNATPTQMMIQNITFTLFLIGFAINFFLYCGSGQNFRRATRSLFTRQLASRRKQEYETQETAIDSEIARRKRESIRRKSIIRKTPVAKIENENTIVMTTKTTPITTTILNEADVVMQTKTIESKPKHDVVTELIELPHRSRRSLETRIVDSETDTMYS